MSENIINIRSVPSNYQLTRPVPAWRLALRNGRPILQASRIWTDGIEAGIEWEDVPTVNSDTRENTNG